MDPRSKRHLRKASTVTVRASEPSEPDASRPAQSRLARYPAVLDPLEPIGSRLHAHSRIVHYGGDSSSVAHAKRPRVDDGPNQIPSALMTTRLDVAPLSIPTAPLSSSHTQRFTGGTENDYLLAETYGLDIIAFDALPIHVNIGMADDTAAYWHALTKVGGVFRLDTHSFVLQDWDSEDESLKIGTYYHLLRLPHGPAQYGIACNCPRWKAHNSCIHHQTVDVFSRELMLSRSIAPSPLPSAVLVHCTPFHDAYIFSCSSSLGRYESGKRVIVALQRDGRWHCQSCRYSDTCKHKPHAVKFAAEAGIISESDLSLPPDSCLGSEASDVENTLLMKAGGRDDGLGLRGCISHISIPPPRWCSLPLEASLYAVRPNVHGSHFVLGSRPRCCCGFEPQDNEGSRLQAATVFGFTNKYEVTIDVIPCPICCHRRRLIGPDLGVIGVFNWNNSYLFTHELLNAFTSAYTTSETPFSAYCVTVRHSYEEHFIGNKFCSDETFVRVWFAFIQLQELASGMACPTCGPNPTVVIADGVSLGTHSSKLTASVKPPTHTDRSSEVIDSISTYKARQLPAIVEADIRAGVNKFLDLSATALPSTELAYPMDWTKLCAKYPDLANLIILLHNRVLSSRVQKACHALLRQIAAPDIVLQFVPYAAIQLLENFASTGIAASWLQSLCPAFGVVLNAHAEEKTQMPLQIICVAKWLASRASDVYSRLAQHDPAIPVALKEEDWNETGTCYGLPPIRTRRVYNKLQYDSKPQDLDVDEMGDCKKFYKTYSRSNLTGGILVLWCTHSICLGFHSIPTAEGRNDVFSAIYTHFSQAPKTIVYDFACQLAPYCFVREARYFRDTRFLIDEMHAHDHTRCGQACFASNLMQFDEGIRAINTSAAECGNKGIHRIRKTVSFMTYEHAVVFTKVFMDVWNRGVIRRMSKV